MPAVAERPAYIADYDAFAEGLAQPGFATELRRRGRERFEEVGFPTLKDEGWRHTNVAPIARSSYRRAAGTAEVNAAQLKPFRMADYATMVFINGHFAPELSDLADLPAEAWVGNLGRALEECPERVEPHLGMVDLENPFVALNTAHLRDGAFLHVPRGVRIERPIHLIFLGTHEDGEPVVSYPRNLIVAEESAEVTVIEDYAGFSGERYFTCPVTEIYGTTNSVIDHYRLGQESLDAFHIATQKLHLERDTNFFTHSVSHGGGLVRNDIQAYLGGSGINCTLNGLYLARGKQLVDHHMWIDHAEPHCNSYELFKGILEDQARAVFNGRIHVHQDAQKTDAKQSNRNLLLSKDALVQSNPQLEIYADDVRCTHGSTTGHLDEEGVFYLRSRGIDEEAAKSLLTYAFAVEVLDEFRLEPLRKDIEEFLFTRLPKGHVVRQAV